MQNVNENTVHAHFVSGKLTFSVTCDCPLRSESSLWAGEAAVAAAAWAGDEVPDDVSEEERNMADNTGREC